MEILIADDSVLLREGLRLILTDAGHHVVAGVGDPEVVQQVFTQHRRNAPVQALTPREREVLELMAQGHSNARIAAELVVTEGAVEKHSQRIFAKLGLQADAEVHRRVSAVLMLLRTPA